MRQTIKFDAERMPIDLSTQLRELERSLRPQQLTHRICAYVFAEAYDDLDEVDGEVPDWSEETIREGATRSLERIQQLGREAASNLLALKTVLPELLTQKAGQHFWFGQGLADGTNDLINLWCEMRSSLSSIAAPNRNVQLIRGVISNASRREPFVIARFLSESVTDPVLAEYYPFLESALVGDDGCGERLKRSLKYGIAPTNAYRGLYYWRGIDSIPRSIFSEIVLTIQARDSGQQIAVELLWMRFNFYMGEQRKIDEEILQLGRQLLSRICFTDHHEATLAYKLVEISKRCLIGEAGIACALEICKHIAEAMRVGHLVSLQFSNLIDCLFELQPQTALIAFLNSSGGGGYSPLRRYFVEGAKSPLDKVPATFLLDWVAEDFAHRAPLVASEINLFNCTETRSGLALSTVARTLLDRAPEKALILQAFGKQMSPTAWSGSLASALRPYLAIANELQVHDDESVRSWAQRVVQNLNDNIRRDDEMQRKVDLTFE